MKVNFVKYYAKPEWLRSNLVAKIITLASTSSTRVKFINLATLACRNHFHTFDYKFDPNDPYDYAILFGYITTHSSVINPNDKDFISWCTKVLSL